MKSSDRRIVMGVGMLVLVAGFYFMVLSPKRDEAKKLDEELTTLQASIDQQEQTVAFGEQARKEFPRFYSRLVVHGKAVPDQADSASLLVQLNSIASNTRVQFDGIKLAPGGATGVAAPPPAAPPAAPAEGGAAPAEGAAPPAAGAAPPAAGSTATPASGTTAATGTTAAPVLATEASAAALPIGAVVGPAGFPTLPYELAFRGEFFQVADFLGGVDSLVTTGDDGTRVTADGRLLTVDGFALKGAIPPDSPFLTAQFAVTSYVVPPEQGLTAGATPGGPAPAPVTPPATPASATTP